MEFREAQKRLSLAAIGESLRVTGPRRADKPMPLASVPAEVHVAIPTTPGVQHVPSTGVPSVAVAFFREPQIRPPVDT